MNTTPTTSTEVVTAALAAHPESSTAELAEAAGIGGSTASKYLAALEVDDASTTRLRKGELSTLVLDYLKAHGDDAIGPSAIGKKLSRSSGATANACQRLESSGSLRLVSDSPRRYQIADA